MLIKKTPPSSEFVLFYWVDVIQMYLCTSVQEPKGKLCKVLLKVLLENTINIQEYHVIDYWLPVTPTSFFLKSIFKESNFFISTINISVVC